MASGFNGQNFRFHGYIPIDKNEKMKKLESMQKDILQNFETQIFIETPYRNDQMLQDLINSLDRNTELCVACDITLSTEFIKTYSIKQWKKMKVSLHKRPAIFIIHKDPLSI